MAWDRHAEAFLEMLAAERGAARNTISAYAADLEDFGVHCRQQGVAPAEAEVEVLRSYGRRRAGFPPCDNISASWRGRGCGRMTRPNCWKAPACPPACPRR
jgi:site-specific recombinase XerD